MEEIKRPRSRPPKAKPIKLTTATVRKDDWENVITGLGQKQDKSQYTTYRGAAIMDDRTLFDMYMGDGLASRIVDIVADDMTREWIWFPKKTQRDAIFPVLDALDAELAFNTALKWQRLFGGSLMLIGAMDGNAIDKPLNEEKIKSIEYLKVVDKTSINIRDSVFDTDPSSPRFGKVQLYHLSYSVQNEQIDMWVHHSRCLEFHNEPIPVGRYSGLDLNTRYWGLSSLQKISEALRDLGGINQSIVNIMYNFVSGVYKFTNLAELLASDVDGKKEAALVKRLNSIQATQSILNATILDKEEDFTRQYTTLAGIPEVVDRFMLQLTGSSGIPVTRLYGRAPAGLNATGESDTRNYYDLTEASQRNRLKPPLLRLTSLIARMKGITDVVELEFNSLYQLSEQEKSEIEKIDAETAHIKATTNLALIELGIRDSSDYAKEMGWEEEFQSIEYDPSVAKPPKLEEPEENDNPEK